MKIEHIGIAILYAIGSMDLMAVAVIGYAPRFEIEKSRLVLGRQQIKASSSSSY
jgi:hypothetical protein